VYNNNNNNNNNNTLGNFCRKFFYNFLRKNIISHQFGLSTHATDSTTLVKYFLFKRKTIDRYRATTGMIRGLQPTEASDEEEASPPIPPIPASSCRV